ncbi:MAG: iron-containing alcohol dehydrogenase [Eubacteriales bacterium]
MPNPSVHCVEKAVLQYMENNCHEIIVVGGESPMDCAKIVAAKIAKPNLPIEKMGGLLKIRKKLVPIIAIPTTAGTGSETTVTAVVTNEENHKKYAITDMCLVPTHTAIIPELTASLPKHITATTGVDALTHAIESYIGNANTRETKMDALKANFVDRTHE